MPQYDDTLHNELKKQAAERLHGYHPYVVVNLAAPDVDVGFFTSFANQDGTLTLQLGAGIRDLVLTDKGFTGTFAKNGRGYLASVPWAAVVQIRVETGTFPAPEAILTWPIMKLKGETPAKSEKPRQILRLVGDDEDLDLPDGRDSEEN